MVNVQKGVDFRLFKINNGVFGSNNLITLPLPRQKKIRKGTESFPSLFPIRHGNISTGN